MNTRAVTATVRCVGCGRVDMVPLSEVEDVPMCSSCFSPCVVQSVEVKSS